MKIFRYIIMIIVVIFPYLLLLSWFVLNQYLFVTFLGVSYFKWYLQYGPVLTGGMAILTLVWDLNLITNLISDKPWRFLKSYGEVVVVISSSFKVGIEEIPFNYTQPLHVLVLGVFQTVVSALIEIALILIPVLWFLITTPIHYFLVFFLGHPGRQFIIAPKKLLMRYNNDRLETKEIYRSEEIPDGWVDASFSQKPVTFTYTLIAFILTIIKAIVL